MHNIYEKCVEKILRAKKEALSRFEKGFFDSWNWLLALPAYDFLKSDKNRFLVSYNNFYLSYDALV